MRGLLGLWMALAAVSPAGAWEAMPFRFYKDVETGALTQEEILAVPLDGDVYAATRDDLPDLRIVGKDGEEVPYVVEKATATRREKSRNRWRARDASLRPVDEGGVEIVVRRGEKDASAEGIRLVTPLKDFEHRVRVFGSDDGESWQPLVDDALIFDYSRYMDVSNNDVPLPKNGYLQFRVVIDDVTAEQESELLELTRRLRGGEEDERFERFNVRRRPFRIDRIEFWHDAHRERVKGVKKTEYEVAEFGVEENAKDKTTVIEIQTRRAPLTALSIKTPSRNFSRRAVVQVPRERGVRTEWREIAGATFSRIDFRDLQREHLKIGFSEERRGVRHERYRLVIENGDSRPLEITGVEARGNVYRLVFLASPDAAYRLYYGSEGAEKPGYDAAAVLATLKRGYEPKEARLGDEVANPSMSHERGITLTRLLNNPVVLGVLICLLVVVLGWVLFRAGRRIEQATGE